MSNQAELDGVGAASALNVAKLLWEDGATVATAESCTGGLLAGALTSVAGSSAYFLGGVISYDNRVKLGLLEVPAELIAEHGAVSAPAALAMAKGVQRLVGAELALSITGIAGPDGGTCNKPVGTTFIACVAPGVEEVRRFQFEEDRAGNRARAVQSALMMLASLLEARGEGVRLGRAEREASSW